MVVPEQLPWAQRSVKGEMWHQPNSTARALLDAKPADWARGTVRVLKCKLCPDAGFKNWADFKRHCDKMETHPREIEFCETCGDFFARPDSLRRHRKSRPLRCTRVDENTAKEKRRKTIDAYETFKARLEQCLETGGTSGSLLPRFRQQNRL
ncbi:hypothetical protein BC826DRAFT_1053745 [Russula brevipes]|nr:hypothetical protein BC826DRAFT_1053745 [Russula brevipes]